MFTASDFELGSIELPEARKVDRRGQARNLTPENLGAIFAELPSDKWRAVFAIAYFTGSRISEVLSLDVSDIGTDRISFRRENTKTRKPRVAMVVDALRPFLAAYDIPQAGHLFPARHNAKGSSYITRQAADLVLRDVCVMIDLDGVSTHSFRRSFATNLHRQGYSLAKIARLLDHSSPTMTARYVE
ncbi:site-specific integrase [Leptolyngbya sp. CCNP1308]|uniref:tyrosine-type recombinase/integrase n=1 Tax=Leptolyngbya sp. CCNP1308 TaxID=3110255 RepID=UPI002B1FFE44|nr:site-specific integrase [Leptolyngbya sp. CCNP1308]MEA5449440.1 site-specific integrase [Leptolyngbya sp. CCNP1308]